MGELGVGRAGIAPVQWRLFGMLLRGHGGRLAALGALLVVSSALPLAGPQLLRAFIDRAAIGRPIAILALIASAYVGVALARQALTVATAYGATHLAWTTTNELRGVVVRHALELDLSFHGAHPPGEMIERADGDVTAVSTFVSSFVVNVLGSALTLAGVLVAVLVEDWRLGLGLVGFVDVAAVTTGRLRNSAVPQATERQEALGSLFGEIEERLVGAEDLRANGGGGHAVRRLLEATAVVYRTAVRAGRASIRIYIITMGVFLAGSALSLVVGTALFRAGAISLGTVYLLFGYTNLLRQPLERISEELRHVQNAVAGLARINQLLGERASVRDEGTRTLPAGALPVELDGVGFAYDYGEPVLTGLSIQVRPGTVLGVVGRTGSGKSTLARLLLRLADPTEGVVRVGGVDARELRLDDLRAGVGLVTQEVQLLQASVRDNLTVFGPHPAGDARLVEVLDSLGLGDWYRALPRGLDTTLGPGGEGASAGEAQLLAFARVFVRDPGLVILDEAASRVDPVSEARIEHALDKLLEGRTTIVIAHRLGTVARTDEIVVLERGRIAEHGPRLALADDPGSRFARLLATGLTDVLVGGWAPAPAARRAEGAGAGANWEWRMTAQVTTGRLSWLLSRYRLGLAAATVALLVVSNGLLVLIGALLQRIFDALTGAAPAGLGVYEVIAVLVAVETVRIGVAWGSNVVWTACWQQMLGLLRLNLLHAQMQSGGPEAGTPAASPGDAVSRLRHEVVDVAGFIDTWTYVVGRAFFAVGSVAIMIQVNPLITVAVVLPLVAMVVAARMLTGRIRTHRRAYRHATAEATSFVGEMFGAVLAIKAARAGEAVQRRLATLNDHRERMALRDKLLSNLLDAFNTATVDLSVGLVLLLAASSMHSGAFTVGDLALFASYAATLVALPHSGGRLLSRHRQAGVAIERLTNLMPPGSPAALVSRRPLYLSGRVPPVEAPRDTARDPLHILDVRGLTAVHPASGRGVRDLDLTLERATFTVVSGPVGAGKTTMLRALLGLMPTQGGVVSWNGDPVRDRAAFMVPPRCAYVPQVPQLFSESLEDNVLLGLNGTADLAAAIRIAVLDEDLAGMPDGLATRVGARGVRLSGGQVQRTATVRATVRRPDLLVLDDVSSALDVETEHQLWDRLLADGRTGDALLVASNRPATIARADQVIHLDQGRRLDAHPIYKDVVKEAHFCPCA